MHSIPRKKSHKHQLLVIFSRTCLCSDFRSQSTIRWSKKSPFSYVSELYTSQLLQYLAHSIRVNLQHDNYRFTRLTYVMLLHYLGIVICCFGISSIGLPVRVRQWSYSCLKLRSLFPQIYDF